MKTKKNKSLIKFFIVLISVILIYAVNDAIHNPDDFLKGFFQII